MERGTELWSGNKAKNTLSCPPFSHQPNSKKAWNQPPNFKIDQKIKPITEDTLFQSLKFLYPLKLHLFVIIPKIDIYLSNQKVIQSTRDIKNK